MPSGEVFTGPLEDSAERPIRYTVPSSPRGVEVAGIELSSATARSSTRAPSAARTTCCATLDTDPGARRLGEIGIGTNTGIDRPIGTILFDEKIGGTVHLAVGRCYPETGGVNESAVHWDMICDLRAGGRLTADGEVVARTALRAERCRATVTEMRRTKIVATIGPASRDPEVLVRMVEAGMDVARLNFSHGTREEHAETVQRVRDAANRAGRPVAILQDLPGPKLRIGELDDGLVELKPGDDVTFVCGEHDEEGDARRMSITWAGLADTIERRRGGLPRRRRGAPAGRRTRAPATARSTPSSRSAARSPRARGSTSPARPTRCRPCPRRTSSTSRRARRSASTSSRCRSCAAPRTSRRCASTRACR